MPPPLNVVVPRSFGEHFFDYYLLHLLLVLPLCKKGEGTPNREYNFTLLVRDAGQNTYFVHKNMIPWAIQNILKSLAPNCGMWVNCDSCDDCDGCDSCDGCDRV